MRRAVAWFPGQDKLRLQHRKKVSERDRTEICKSTRGKEKATGKGYYFLTTQVQGVYNALPNLK